MTYPWFRMYNELLSDRKIKRVALVMGVPKVMVLGVWSGLLLMANASPVRGELVLGRELPYTNAEIAEEIGVARPTLETMLAEFVSLGMMSQDNETWIVTKFCDRQYQSDHSANRVRKHRERRAQQPAPAAETANGDECNGDEPLHGRYSNAPDQTRSDTDQTRPEAPRQPVWGRVLANAGIFPSSAREGEMWADVAEDADRGPPGLFAEAVNEAVSHNVRTLAYVRRIVDRCVEERRMPGPRKGAARASPTNQAPTLPPGTPFMNPITGEMDGDSRSEPTQPTTT